MEKIAPNTVAGFNDNGIIGAFDGATGAIMARCKLVDGTEVRIAAEEFADEINALVALGKLRSAREKICSTVADARALGDAVDQ